MLKLTGTLEVFKNRNGYITGIIKSFDKDDKSYLGNVCLDVSIPESVEVKEGQTLTLKVTEGYLNIRHVVAKGNSFDKLFINVVKCKVVKVYPEEKKVAKPSKKVKE